MPPSLSALIIAKDEQRDLPGCLESIKGLVAETVIVVDAASCDATERLAREAGCKVLVRPFDDYARQRQAALDACTQDWVLWVDCDERPDGELRRAIEALEPAHAAYRIRFAVKFMGRVMRWGGLGSETHVRLFRRDKARFTGGALHEGLEIDGTTGGPLPGRMEHEPYKDEAEYMEKLHRYTDLAARKKRAAGARFRWFHHLVLPGELLKRLVLRLGFLDGQAGVRYAVLSAYHHWLKYAKLKKMEVSE